jgi:hypothetical protein
MEHKGLLRCLQEPARWSFCKKDQLHHFDASVIKN